jgi:hypothetical protein
MANKKSHLIVYRRRTGRRVVQIKGPASTVMPFAWFDRLTALWAVAAWIVGLSAGHWQTLSTILHWLLQKIKSG